MTNTIHYSAATGGFYHSDHHAEEEIPSDAVRITAARHAELMEGQGVGRRIIAGADGRPALAPLPVPDLAQLRDDAAWAVRVETRRRILGIASVEDQANDSWELMDWLWANGGDYTAPLTASAEAAIGRRRQIEAVRAAGRKTRATIAQMPASNLINFDATAERLWPAGE